MNAPCAEYVKTDDSVKPGSVKKNSGSKVRHTTLLNAWEIKMRILGSKTRVAEPSTIGRWRATGYRSVLRDFRGAEYGRTAHQ